MVSQIPEPTQSEVLYPDGDGQALANNTIQLLWLVEIQQNLDDFLEIQQITNQ